MSFCQLYEQIVVKKRFRVPGTAGTVRFHHKPCNEAGKLLLRNFRGTQHSSQYEVWSLIPTVTVITNNDHVTDKFVFKLTYGYIVILYPWYKIPPIKKLWGGDLPYYDGHAF